MATAGTSTKTMPFRRAFTLRFIPTIGTGKKANTALGKSTRAAATGMAASGRHSEPRQTREGCCQLVAGSVCPGHFYIQERKGQRRPDRVDGIDEMAARGRAISLDE